MANAKQEFLNLLFTGKSVTCARIMHGGWMDEYTNVIILPIGYSDEQWKEFLNTLDFEYDSGYGSQQLFGIVWFDDGSWADRREYDGSEWWDVQQRPDIHDDIINFKCISETHRNYTQEDDYQEQIDDNNEEEYYDYYGNDNQPDSEYVIASTSKRVNETYVFPSDESGEIGIMLELGGRAERFGHSDWENHKLAVDEVMGEGRYEFVKNVVQTDELSHNLYKRVQM